MRSGELGGCAFLADLYCYGPFPGFGMEYLFLNFSKHFRNTLYTANTLLVCCGKQSHNGVKQLNLHCPSFQKKVPRLLQVAQMKPLRIETKVSDICGFLSGHRSKCRNDGKSKGECEVKLLVIWNKTVSVS